MDPKSAMNLSVREVGPCCQYLSTVDYYTAWNITPGSLTFSAALSNSNRPLRGNEVVGMVVCVLPVLLNLLVVLTIRCTTTVRDHPARRTFDLVSHMAVFDTLLSVCFLVGPLLERLRKAAVMYVFAVAPDHLWRQSITAVYVVSSSFYITLTFIFLTALSIYLDIYHPQSLGFLKRLVRSTPGLLLSLATSMCVAALPYVYTMMTGPESDFQERCEVLLQDYVDTKLMFSSKRNSCYDMGFNREMVDKRYRGPPEALLAESVIGVVALISTVYFLVHVRAGIKRLEKQREITQSIVEIHAAFLLFAMLLVVPGIMHLFAEDLTRKFLRMFMVLMVFLFLNAKFFFYRVKIELFNDAWQELKCNIRGRHYEKNVSPEFYPLEKLTSDMKPVV